MADLRPRSNVPAGAPSRKQVRAAREGNGLWDRPQLLNLIADLLILVGTAGLGYAAVAGLSGLPTFPLREVVVTTPLGQVTNAQLEYAARSSIRGNFFTVNLDQVRSAFEKLPWVRRAEVRRRWPGAVEVRLEEHVATAYWRVGDTGEMRLVNRQGEVFSAASNASMPMFSGPEGSASLLLSKYAEFSRAIAPLGRHLVGLSLSARQAWQLRTDDGLLIDLGRDQPRAPTDARLARFVSVFPEAQQKLNMKIAVADLRYPGGFTLRPGRAEPEDSKGK
ncbi:MAG: cell division protein FtsQ/DivIB [Zoogloea sp.]|nr:cell division protein FtsQ/DivIB [Zoogloea sp.]